MRKLCLAVIEFRNVQKIYPPDQVALKQVSLKFNEGEFVFIAGASGAGKSTLLKLILGAERASEGELLVLGENFRHLSSRKRALTRRDIGVVFQDYKLLTQRTVIENVAMGLEIRGVARSERTRLSRELLRAMKLEDRAGAFPRMLSGGEQQRVAIARALIHKPRLILADEPTGNLDVHMTRVVFDLLLQANRAGVTVIVASHNLSIIEELGMRTIVLDRGKIIGDFERSRGAA